MAVVLALAVVALRFVLPQVVKGRGKRSARIDVLEVSPLDRQTKLALVRVGKNEMLVGFGAGQVRRLGAWPAAEGAAEIDTESPEIVLAADNTGGEMSCP